MHIPRVKANSGALNFLQDSRTMKKDGVSAVAAVVLTLLLATASAATVATEQRAQGLGDYVRHKVGDVVDTVKGKIGSEWGGSRVEEAEAQIPGSSGEIEYVKISKGGSTGEMMPGNAFTRTWSGISNSFGWAGRKAEQGAEDMYEAAVNVKNKAGQTWNDAMHSAFDQWHTSKSTKSDSRQSWDQAKKAAWDTWSATANLPRQAVGAASGAASGMADTASDAYEHALKAVYDKWSTSGGDASGQTWESVASAFRNQWRAASRNPEDALADAFDEWISIREQTGVTWDEFKRKAMADYDESRWRSGVVEGARDKAQRWTESATSGWENWLRSAYSSFNRTKPTDAPAEAWTAVRETAKKSYDTVAATGKTSWQEAEQAARAAYDATKDTTSETMESIMQGAWQRWLEASAFAGGNIKDAMKASDSYWSSTKGKSKEGYDIFVNSVWDAWFRARNAAGGTWDDAQSALKDYYSATKHTTKAVYNDLVDRAWTEWVKSTAGSGGDWSDVETAAKKQYGNIKKSTKMAYNDFLAQTRATYDEATSGPSWLHNVSDSVACMWDDTKCRGAGAWEGLKHTFRVGHVGGKTAEELRKETHGKVDELYKAAAAGGKAEL
jgi:hypothetical protein